MDKRTYDELVKLVGEERAKQFESQVDDANRTITDTGMITRADATPDPEASPAPEVAAPPVAPAITLDPTGHATEHTQSPVVEIRQEPPAPDEEKPDEEGALKAAVAALSERVAKLEQAISARAEVDEAGKTQQRALDDKLADMASRLAGVEASKDRWDTWINDAPEYIKQDAEKIFRARNQEPAPMTLSQIAEQSLSKMHRGPLERHGK